jgi:pilus assembly protein Flp/PilA
LAVNRFGKEETMVSRINEALTWLVARYEREDGQALAEYGLLLALIAVVCIVALTALGLAIAGTLSTITGKL